MVGNSSRSYVLSVPKDYVSSTAMPLVFAFHGMGGSGKIARQYFGVEAAAQDGAIFAYPDGLPVNDAGSAGWDLGASGIDFAFFDTLLAALANTYCVDRNRVFVVGHSFGGVMTNALGCYRGDVIRAIAPVAGMPPGAYGGSPKCVGSVAAIVLHGENDPTVDFTKGGIGARDFWRGRNGCSTETQADSSAGCVDYTGCQADLPVVWCVHTQAHDFPFGRCDASACLNGGAAIWGFFESFN
jgi:poly(3-hydroxybutyrate) depolymerase